MTITHKDIYHIPNTAHNSILGNRKNIKTVTQTIKPLVIATTLFNNTNSDNGYSIHQEKIVSL